MGVPFAEKNVFFGKSLFVIKMGKENAIGFEAHNRPDQ